jgi:hypothetical protein
MTMTKSSMIMVPVTKLTVLWMRWASFIRAMKSPVLCPLKND